MSETPDTPQRHGTALKGLDCGVYMVSKACRMKAYMNGWMFFFECLLLPSENVRVKQLHFCHLTDAFH